MIEVRVSDAGRDLAAQVKRVTYGDERVLLTDRGKPLAALVSAADAKLLQRLEDEADAAILRERLNDDEAALYLTHAEVVASLGE